MVFVSIHRNNRLDRHKGIAALAILCQLPRGIRERLVKIIRRYWVAGLILLMADIVPLFIMALGMTFAIYIGGIDLSVQQLANMVTVIATVYLAQFGWGVALVAIFAGGLVGMISGFVTTRLFQKKTKHKYIFLIIYNHMVVYFEVLVRARPRNTPRPTVRAG